MNGCGARPPRGAALQLFVVPAERAHPVPGAFEQQGVQRALMPVPAGVGHETLFVAGSAASMRRQAGATALHGGEGFAAMSFSKKSVEFFKSEAAKHHTQYQRMIRRLIDAYVENYDKPLTSRSTRTTHKSGARPNRSSHSVC